MPAQAFVPAASTLEIFNDKVFALAARPYLKPRDVFDLHWLRAHEADLRCTEEHLRMRLATYPNQTPQAWLTSARSRVDELPRAAAAIGRDLARWLPSSWPLAPAAVRDMVAAAVDALGQGVQQMQKLADRQVGSGGSAA